MKNLDHENWLLADGDGKALPADVRNWREAFLCVTLGAAVPEALRRMFEAARGGMLYGYFFQPLMAMGLEQCYRTLERAARMRCEQLGLAVTCADSQGRSHPLSFSHNLRALGKQGLIAGEEQTRWQQVKELRDWLTSPEHQGVVTHEHAVIALARTAELLDRLFSNQSSPGEPALG